LESIRGSIMAQRRMRLPPGWYPRGADAALSQIRALERKSAPAPQRNAVAGVSPHAGWYYCAPLAVRAFERLDPEADLIIVFGGHLPARSTSRLAFEDSFETPLGPIEADSAMRDIIASEIDCAPDDAVDNTVEVLLPFAKRFHPASRLLWLRVPNDASSIDIGKKAASAAVKLGRRAVAVGSTDLTHYGDAYGFAPRGRGARAIEWVREENDARIVAAMAGMEDERTIDLGEGENSACSSGAAAAAISFARVLGAARGEINGYATSADAQGGEEPLPDQFVGYASISYLR
jgi:AmmeMemoRadiSam system protein B